MAASVSFTASGTPSGDELVVPILFAATASGVQSVVLYGEDVTANINADYNIDLNIPRTSLNGVFAYDSPPLGSNPYALRLQFTELSHAFDVSFSSQVTTLVDDSGASITTPYGDFRNYITALSSWTGLHERDDTIKSVGEEFTCSRLLGESTVVNLSSDFTGPLATLYERAAAAGKINTSGDTSTQILSTWELQAGDKVTVYVQFDETHSLDFEFDTETHGVDPSFTPTALSNLSSIVVYYGSNASSVTIQDVSQSITKIYKLTLTAVEE